MEDRREAEVDKKREAERIHPPVNSGVSAATSARPFCRGSFGIFAV